MKLNKKLTSLLLATAMAFTAMVGTKTTHVHAANTTTVSIEVSAAEEIKPGAEVPANVVISNNAGLCGLKIELEAPEGFSIKHEATNNTVVATNGTILSTIQTGPNTIIWTDTSAEDKTGNGTLATITLIAATTIEPGDYEFEVTVSEAYNVNLDDVEVEVGKTTVTVECAHTEDNGTVTLEPTCTKEGTKTFKCTACGETLRTEKIPATGHTADNGTVTLEPTCTKEGTKTFKCTVCGEVVKTEPIAAKGHTSDEGTVTLEPTCDKEGTKTYKCTECGEVIKTEPIPAKGHNYGEDDKCTECGAEKPVTPPADEEDKDDVSTETGDTNLIAPLMSVMMLSAVALVLLKKRENLE